MTKKIVMAEGEIKMAKQGNIEYMDTTVTCACGETFTTKSTKPEIRVDVCSKCHPFYTGKQTRASKAGNVEKFNAKYGFKSDALNLRAEAVKIKQITPLIKKS